MNKSKLFLLALLSLMFACNDDDLFEKFSDPEYPTRYCILSDAEINELYDNFDSDLKIYFEVDSFGFLHQKIEKINSSIYNGVINNSDTVLLKIKLLINDNWELYGITDTALLKVDEIKAYWHGGSEDEHLNNDINKDRWYVKFQSQFINGIEVYNSKIGFYLCPAGVYRSYGHWYPEIHLPADEDVSFEEAKKDLIGKTFTWVGMAGGVEHTLTIDDFYDTEEPERIIIPFRKEDCIEMRLCWKIRTDIWYFYVDVMSGELIMKEQTFIS